MVVFASTFFFLLEQVLKIDARKNQNNAMIGIIANAAKAANTDDDDFFPFDSPDPDPHEYLVPLKQVVGSEVVEDKV